jgi:hypothetical protein
VTVETDFTTERQSLVSVQGIPGYFSTLAGGDTTATATDVWPGGTTDPAKVAGPSTTGNVTVTRPFKASRDQEILKALTPLCGRWRSTISRQWTDADLTVVGDPDVWPNALLLEVHRPGADAASNNQGMMELVFAPTNTV